MKLIECPRDAMQGLQEFIPTASKVQYLNALLEVGFDTLDFGSFVSPKAIPQMADTAQVIRELHLSKTQTQLLAIVANGRGADDALSFEEIDYLGFPLSISETFQQRNTNKSIGEALKVVKGIQQKCVLAKKKLVVYLSMGFGNPYGEPYSAQVVIDFTEQLKQEGIKIISLADSIGVSTPGQIKELFQALIPAHPEVEFGAHFHSVPQKAAEKVTAAYEAGCRRIDAALGGMGGCPMAKDDLTGNIATETLLACLEDTTDKPSIDYDALSRAQKIKQTLFG